MLVRFRAVLCLGLIAAGLLGFASVAFAGQPGAVLEVPISGTIDQGTVQLVSRAVAQANADHASALVLDIDSSGGLLDSAYQIRDVVFDAKEPVVAFVDHRAFSAAALIALSADRIVMAPSASIGAAEPIPATDKTIADLRAQFESTATRNHRDASIAGAMVDKTIDEPAYKRPGTILTLNADDAMRAHIADAVAPTLTAALAEEHLADAPRVNENYSFGEMVMQFATDPIVAGFLLTLGMLGLLVEMQTMHSIAGTIGVAALVLFFGSHVYAGFSNALVIVLAVLGVLGIIWELHIVPGHTVPGVVGGALLFFAVLLAFGLPSFTVGVETVATAVVMTIALFALFARAYPHNAWVERMALADAQGPEFVAGPDLSALRGALGMASSFLRPAGVALFDGQRVTVLTEGEFIAQGTPVRVIRVEGARVFVEPVHLPSYQ